MIIKIDFIENSLELEDDKVFSIECENKNYFYRIVHNLNNLSQGYLVNSIVSYKDSKEYDLSNKAELFIDFFNINFDSKKYQNKILNLLQKKLSEENIIKINSYIQKINRVLSNKLGQIDIPLTLEEINIDKVYKQLKFNVDVKENLIDNLYTIIDIERIFRINEVIIFVNLKQYLSKIELEEFYKYTIYNQIKIILIDSQTYGVSNNYEKKLLIDSDLIEFML